MTRTLPQIIARLHERPQQLTAVKFKKESVWVEWTWSEYQSNIECAYWLLKEKGVKPEDRVIIISGNRVEWALCDLACQCLGAVTVPIYPNSSDNDLQLILSETEPDLIFVENEELLQRLPKSLFPKVLLFKKPRRSQLENEKFFWWGMNLVSKEGRIDRKEFLKQCEKPDIKDLATIVYTSGTSGVPKGICLTHRQVTSELKDVADVFPITSQDMTLSFLPYAHVLGRVEMWLSVHAGFTLAFCESIDKVKTYLLEIQPTVLIAVPRIFEKIYASVISKLNRHQLQRFVNRYEDKGLLGSLSVAPIRLVLQKQVQHRLKEALGGRLKYAISGGAPLSREVSRFFKKCDVLLLEGYGLTETTGAICVNTPDSYSFGTVGRPLPDVQIKLGEDGEILVKSDKVFDHYLSQPEIDPKTSDGYYPTGDIGEWTKEGFLRVTDRKKDLIKTSGGKYVAPQRIENLFKRYPLISQSLIFGDQRKYVVALLTLDPTELRVFAEQRKIPFSKVRDLAHSPQVFKEVEEIVKSVNSELSSFESIKRFQILDEELSIAKGELTPSLKVRRKFCEEKFKPEIDQLYGM